MKAYLSCLLISLCSIGSLLADEGFVIKKYTVEVLLLDDGQIKVTEDLQVEFLEQRRGIFRTIPIHYSLGQDKNYKINVRDIQVANWNYKISTKGRNKEIRIGHPDRYLTGIQDYSITYHVDGAIAHYEDSDEFYWNVIGPEWEVPIERVAYEVRFPYGWRSKVTDYQVLIGDRGTSLATLDTLTENIISSNNPIALGPKQGVTVSFQLPKGLLPVKVQNSAQSKPELTEVGPSKNWLSLIPAGLAALLFGQWRQKGRRQPDIVKVDIQYHPPVGMSPAQVGTFYDYKVNRRDIIALLPYWGDKGYLYMRQLEEDVYFEKIKDISSEEPEYARHMFNKLFEKSDNTLLSSFKEKMYQTVASTATKIMKEVKAKELYDQKALKTFHSGWLIAFFLILLGLGIASIVVLQAVMMGVGLIILGVYAFVLHFMQPKLSDKGYTMHQYLRGLYQFLKDPDPEKLADLMSDNPNYINQVFPYALAFGLDKEWERYFKDRDYHAPDWYIYDGAHHQGNRPSFGTFTKDFGAHKIEKVFYSAPASNTSSGGGGGGSVGGGFGGGGGGSW